MLLSFALSLASCFSTQIRGSLREDPDDEREDPDDDDDDDVNLEEDLDDELDMDKGPADEGANCPIDRKKGGCTRSS